MTSSRPVKPLSVRRRTVETYWAWRVPDPVPDPAVQRDQWPAGLPWLAEPPAGWVPAINPKIAMVAYCPGLPCLRTPLPPSVYCSTLHGKAKACAGDWIVWTRTEVAVWSDEAFRRAFATVEERDAVQHREEPDPVDAAQPRE